MPGRIELIMGPMFAGKTTELMRRVKREIQARKTCFTIKYAKDTRYSQLHICSHDQMTLRADAAVSYLRDVGDKWKKFDVIAIDEGQFYQDLLPFATTAADQGKIVFISALDGDYCRKPFPPINEIIPMCETIDKLTAVCMMCHDRPASFTRRTVASYEKELIGGADMYIATCRTCFNDPVIPCLSSVNEINSAIKEAQKVIFADNTEPLVAEQG
eukprot:Tbor_TRINITY_DN3567_c0_g1::TRINITY_DN3567_c0_g1_i1::g.2966::m.2966/K00857/tdk, TK; thymidine kinase